MGKEAAKTAPEVRELFVEELAEIQGGSSRRPLGDPCCTTMACCEEGPFDGCCTILNIGP